MVNCDEIKDRVKVTLEVVAEGAKELAAKAADKAKTAARIARLSLEIAGEKDTIKKSCLEIGKLYYEMHRDDADGFFAQLCDEITVAKADIADKEGEIASLRGRCEEDDMEIELYSCYDDPYCLDSAYCDCEEEAEILADDEDEAVAYAFRAVPPAGSGNA